MRSCPQQAFENRAAALLWGWGARGFSGFHTQVLSPLGKFQPWPALAQTGPGLFSWPWRDLRSLGVPGRGPRPTVAAQEPWVLGSSQGNP